jgi:hypothetical protein
MRTFANRVAQVGALAASIAVICVVTTRANADDRYVGVNDGTCISGKLLSTASGGVGWASPYTMADILRAAGVDVDVETKKTGGTGESLMVVVKIGAVPDQPSLDHANFVYFNNKDVCLKMMH